MTEAKGNVSRRKFLSIAGGTTAAAALGAVGVDMQRVRAISHTIDQQVQGTYPEPPRAALDKAHQQVALYDSTVNDSLNQGKFDQVHQLTDPSSPERKAVDQAQSVIDADQANTNALAQAESQSPAYGPLGFEKRTMLHEVGAVGGILGLAIIGFSHLQRKLGQ